RRSRNPGCSRPRVSSVKSRASPVTCQKSAWWPPAARSHVYCSCLSRQSALRGPTASPSVSAHERAAEAKSKSVPYASTTQALTPESRRFDMIVRLLLVPTVREIWVDGHVGRVSHGPFRRIGGNGDVLTMLPCLDTIDTNGG